MGVNSPSLSRHARKEAGRAYPFGYGFDRAGESCTLKLLRAMTHPSAAAIAHRYPSPRGRCGTSPDRAPASFLSGNDRSNHTRPSQRQAAPCRVRRAARHRMSLRQAGRGLAALRPQAPRSRRSGADLFEKSKGLWNLHHFRGVEWQVRLTQNGEFPTCKTLSVFSLCLVSLASPPVRTPTSAAPALAQAAATSSTAPSVVTAWSAQPSVQLLVSSATTLRRNTATDLTQDCGGLGRTQTYTSKRAIGAFRSGGLFAVRGRPGVSRTALPHAQAPTAGQETQRKGQTCSTRS